MSLRSLLQRIFTTEAPSDKDRTSGSEAAERAVAEEKPERATDVVQVIRALPLAEGVRRAMTELAGDLSRAAAMSLLRWLREVGPGTELPASLRLELAEFFMARAESDTAERVLTAVAAGSVTDAAPAMVALGDILQRGGDVAGAARWYESALAIDLEYPGARERLARLKKPTKAGEAGATLMAPDGHAGVGRFELVKELGRGGAGAVFQARDRRMDRLVALKLYHPQARADRGVRLRGEAQIAASVASPYVVRVYDLFEDLGGLVMEYAAGQSLRQRVARDGVDAATASRWLHDLARALARTHREGWVHRDVKPGNVLLRLDGCAVLTDFGLARRAGAASPAHEGTQGYMAPESRVAGAAHPTMDVYAFGALAAELLGRADPVFGELIARATDEDPARRFVDGDALCVALSRLHAGAKAVR